jgi:uracil phosphoribosyltransferase
VAVTPSHATNRYQGTSINGVYYDYKTSFNIITKSTISNVLTYPNPFSTRTQFVFTLTGSEIPDYMKIQIMTITGKVVKEIQRAQVLQEICIVGVNRAGTMCWDGRDEYGDKLANGVLFLPGDQPR